MRRIVLTVIMILAALPGWTRIQRGVPSLHSVLVPL